MSRRDGPRRARARRHHRGPRGAIVVLCLIAGAVAWVRLGGEYAGRLRPRARPRPGLLPGLGLRAELPERPAGVFSPRRDDAAVPGAPRRPTGSATSRTTPTRRPRCCWPCPLTGLDLPDAVLAWNLVTLAALLASLAIVAADLPELKSLFLPVGVLLPFCLPIYGNFQQGQLTFVLVLLMTSAWALDRSGRPGAAGLLIGAAAALKLFPAYLVVYFAARGRWRGAVRRRGVVRGTDPRDGRRAGLGGLSRLLCGSSCPAWRSSGATASTCRSAGSGTSSSTRPASAGGSAPIWYSPAAARCGTLLSDLLATAIVAARRLPGARRPQQRDLAFAMAVTAMLLVSPITWDYLAPPAAGPARRPHPRRRDVAMAAGPAGPGPDDLRPPPDAS